MDIAQCKADGIEYSAVKFAKLPTAELASKRRNLVCVKCGTKALFVKEAKSGQGPHFRARPHINCPLAAPESERGEGGGNDKDMVQNSGDHIVLNLKYGFDDEVNGDPNSNGGSSSGGGRYTGTGGTRNAVSRRGLRPILKNLIFSEAFRISEQTIEIPDVDTFRVKDLFVNFSDIKPEQVGSVRGFWGDIYDTGDFGGALWINTDEDRKKSVSVVISSQRLPSFLAQHKVKVAELDGMHMLVIGTLERKSTGKLTIRPKGIEFTAIYGES